MALRIGVELALAGLTSPTITTGVICRSAGMQEIFERAKRASARRSKVLITGETGVGKDVVARYIHASSPDARRPFVAVNCAGLADTLLESELFGHVKGSFTGAHRDRPGKLQQAHGGTIFLDEVGEMTPRMQALLLRFLETGELQRVGEDHGHLKVDVRVITATNRDLTEMAAQGLFREDLLFRIRVVHLHVLPLRERREDIRPLVNLFIERLDPDLRLTDAAWDAIGSYHWPGNVRELQNVIEQLASVASDGAIDADKLPWANTAPAGARPRSESARERRRDIADGLLTQIVSGHGSFWDQVHDAFMMHDLTRHNLRDFIALALKGSGGSYRDMLRLLRLPDSDYKRLLKFLSRHDCAVDFRPFRASTVARRSNTSSQSLSEPYGDMAVGL